MDHVQLDFINKSLGDIYGKDLAGRPNFRLVWSTGQFEKRFGAYSDFYGHIFLREVEEVRETHKYPYIKPCYILEKFIYSPMKEIIGSDNGHYEIAWAFLDKKGDSLEPTWKALQFYLRALLWGFKRTKAFYDDFQSEKDRIEIGKMAEQCDEMMSVRTAWMRKNSSVYVSHKNGMNKSVYSAPGTRLHIHR